MGPLQGMRVIEMAGIGPTPYAGMLLADMGAEVIRIDRPDGGSSMGDNPADVLARGRQSFAVDLKNPEGVELVLRLVETADILIEGYRPGVMERLGLGPETCQERNPRLVFGRMTGWGQDGPLAQTAGHDINYIALTGALDAIGDEETGPVPPLNLVGDFGGGSLFLVTGVLAACLEARQSGQGQVVDAAITDGVVSLMSSIHGFKAMGLWDEPRGRNLLDGGAHYYDTYLCADDQWVAVGAIEPAFYARLMEGLGLEDEARDFSDQFDRTQWPKRRAMIAEAFRQKTRDEWCAVFEGTDACFAPVLNLAEALDHPHNEARGNFLNQGGVVQSAPAPRFSRTASEAGGLPVAVGAQTHALLESLGVDQDEFNRLISEGVVMQGGA